MDIPSRCGAKTRGGDRHPCRRPAGWGTDHFGQGRCRSHGGANPIKHGLYSTVLRGAAAELYVAAQSAPTDDPQDTITMHQALLLDATRRWSEAVGAGEQEQADALWPVLRQAVERHARLQQHEAERDVHLTVEEFRDFIERLRLVIAPYLSEASRDQCYATIAALPLRRLPSRSAGRADPGA